MTAKRFARIQDGGVAEIFSTRDRLETLFHSALIWVDVTDRIDVAEGWRFDGNDFAPPVAPAAPSLPDAPSLLRLQEQLRSLTAQMAALGYG